MITNKRIFTLWLPLAAMWLVMGIELPIINGVMARLGNVKENLAAFGITFSIALIIEAPVIQLFVAGTALTNSRKNYKRLLNFMHILAIGLTLIHLLLGLTPAYTLLLKHVIGIPEEIIPLSRRSFLLMTPWAAAIGYRRLWQGILIRYEKTKLVPLTMIIRLAATCLVLFTGYFFLELEGAELGGAALGFGVIIGAISGWYYTRSIIKDDLDDNPDIPELGWHKLLKFYYPLFLTSLVTFIVRPVMSFGLARAAYPIESLAVWPVIISLMFLFRSMAMAYQEVVVSLLNSEQSEEAEERLNYFARLLGITLTAGLIILAISPGSPLLYRYAAGLDSELTGFTRIPTIIVTLIPGLSALISWYRGSLIHNNRTGTIAKGTIINSLILMPIILAGPLVSHLPGAIIAALALTSAMVAETLFLKFNFNNKKDLPLTG
ncbi:MAG: hypothetical protein JEY99_14315 [Spirochaetales bacterium]|nr:hypothetical protein [Spirochaetales bacterium]